MNADTFSGGSVSFSLVAMVEPLLPLARIFSRRAKIADTTKRDEGSIEDQQIEHYFTHISCFVCSFTANEKNIISLRIPGNSSRLICDQQSGSPQVPRQPADIITKKPSKINFKLIDNLLYSFSKAYINGVFFEYTLLAKETEAALWNVWEETFSNG